MKRQAACEIKPKQTRKNKDRAWPDVHSCLCLVSEALSSKVFERVFRQNIHLLPSLSGRTCRIHRRLIHLNSMLIYFSTSHYGFHRNLFSLCKVSKLWSQIYLVLFLKYLPCQVLNTAFKGVSWIKTCIYQNWLCHSNTQGKPRTDWWPDIVLWPHRISWSWCLLCTTSGKSSYIWICMATNSWYKPWLLTYTVYTRLAELTSSH